MTSWTSTYISTMFEINALKPYSTWYFFLVFEQIIANVQPGVPESLAADTTPSTISVSNTPQSTTRCLISSTKLHLKVRYLYIIHQNLPNGALCQTTPQGWISLYSTPKSLTTYLLSPTVLDWLVELATFQHVGVSVSKTEHVKFPQRSF